MHKKKRTCIIKKLALHCCVFGHLVLIEMIGITQSRGHVVALNSQSQSEHSLEDSGHKGNWRSLLTEVYV